MKPSELSPRNGPAGAAGTPAACWAAATWAAIRSWIFEMSPSRRSSVSCAVEQRLLALVAGRVELGLAALELAAGALELGLAVGDLVALGGHPIDGVDRLVAQVADAADDVGVLLLDPLQVLVAVDEVVEAVRVEHHREQVGLAGAVDVDEPVAEHVQRPLQVGAQLVEPDLVAVQLGLLLRQLLLDDRLAVAQHRDLADQLVDLIAVALRSSSTGCPRGG